MFREDWFKFHIFSLFLPMIQLKAHMMMLNHLAMLRHYFELLKTLMSLHQHQRSITF